MTDDRQRDETGDDRRGRGDDRDEHTGRTGAGAEAAEGIHSADGDREESDRTALEGKPTGRDPSGSAGRAGSEPIDSHDREHGSGYGGKMGRPKHGSD